MRNKVESLQADKIRLEGDIVEKARRHCCYIVGAPVKQMNGEMKGFSDVVDKLCTTLVKVNSAFNAKQLL
jgi:hypothetical protein